MKRIMLVIVTLILAVSLSGCALMPKFFGKRVENVKNEEMALTFSFGESTGTYTGEAVEGLPHGKGIFTSDNANETSWTYDGQWKKGHMEGMGETTWEDGFVQQGNYANDLLNGEGKEYLNDNLMYEGNYADNKYDGQGTLYNYYGDVIYEGDFVDGFYNEKAADRKARLDPFKAQTTQLSYNEIYDIAKSENGKKVMMTGTVSYVFESYENQQYFCDFVLDLNNDPNQMVLVYYRLNVDEKPIVVNQAVTVWGTAEYLYTYTSESGQQITMPNVEAWSVE